MPGRAVADLVERDAAPRPRPSRRRARSGTWSVATRSSEPSARPAHSASRSAGGPERRRDDVAGARDRVGLVVALLGQDQVVRAGLGRDPDAGRLGAADLVERRRRREVDDVDRRVGRPGERERPRRRDRLDVRWSRSQRGSAARRHHAASAAATAASSSTGSSQWTWSIPPCARHDAASRRTARASGSRKSKTMNAFEVGDARLDRRRQLGQRVVAWPLIARLRPKSMALSPSVAARHSRTPGQRASARPPGDEPVPGLLNDEERRRAAERRRDRILEEPVRLGVRWRPGCGCGRRRRRAAPAARSRRSTSSAPRRRARTGRARSPR